MGLRINTNVASLGAQRVLASNQARLEHAQQAIASGNRIVHAGDDAAGLAISENIRGELAGIKMARSNAYNAQSLVQVSEGGLNQISNILTRVRELGVQAASDTVSDDERGFINQEAQQLTAESDRIAKSTKFGSQHLLDGTSKELQYQVGPSADEKENTITYKMSANATNRGLGVDGIDLSDKSGARSALETVETAMTKLGQMRADYGAVQSRLEITTGSLDSSYENLSAAKSRISDADVAHEASELTSAQILQNVSVSVLAQSNQNPAAALKLI